MGQAQRIAAGSIGLGLVVLGLKLAAWAVTGSAALFSDAAESVVNVAAAVVAFAALRLAARPADANHLYGHDKAEFFAAVIEGVLIVVAALVILQHAWDTYRHPGAVAGAAARHGAERRLLRAQSRLGAAAGARAAGNSARRRWRRTGSICWPTW